MSSPSLNASVSVIVPSLRGGAQLVALVTRVLSETKAQTEVLIADNGLDEPTVGRLEALGARVLPMGGNRGFARAVNRAARAADGQALAVVNDDVVPTRGFIDALVEPLLHGAEMASGVLLRASAPGVIESAGLEVDAVLNPYDYLQDKPATCLVEGAPPPLGPTGGAAAFLRSAFLEAAGFDEGFFAYLEDLDLAIRLHGLGARCELAPDARAYHEASSTLGYHSLAKASIVAESRGYLIRKYGLLRRPRSAAWVFGAELGASAVLARRHRSLEPARARVRGWRRGRRCDVSLPRSMAAVQLVDGLRRRYRRSL